MRNCREDDQPKIGAHDGHVDAHADAHEEQGQQETTEWLDVCFELMSVVQFGEQHAGEEGSERHGHAGLLHSERSAEHDEERRRGHHLARAGLGEQPEERIEQIAARDHDQCDRAGDEGDRAQPVPEVGMGALASGREQGQHRQQGHDRHVLEQQDGKSTLAVVLLELAAFFQDLQRDGGRRHRQSEPGDDSPAPVDEPSRIAECADGECGEGQLGGAEAEYGASHRQQPTEFEFEPDQEQQHHDTKLGNRDDALGRAKRRKPIRADDDAGDEIGDDSGEPEPARDRYAEDGGGEQHEPKIQKAKFAVLHDGILR